MVSRSRIWWASGGRQQQKTIHLLQTFCHWCSECSDGTTQILLFMKTVVVFIMQLRLGVSSFSDVRSLFPSGAVTFRLDWLVWDLLQKSWRRSLKDWTPQVLLKCCLWSGIRFLGFYISNIIITTRSTWNVPLTCLNSIPIIITFKATSCVVWSVGATPPRPSSPAFTTCLLAPPPPLMSTSTHHYCLCRPRRHRPSHHPPLTHPHLLSRHYARVTPLSLCVRHSELHVAKSVSSVVSIIISFP